MAFRMRLSLSIASAFACLLAAGPVAALDYGQPPLLCMLPQSDSIVVADVAAEGDWLKLGAVRETVAGTPPMAGTAVSIRSRWDGQAMARRGTALLFLRRAPASRGGAWGLAGPNRSGLVWVMGGRLPQLPVAIPGYSESVPTLNAILPAIRDVQACTRWTMTGPLTYTATFTCGAAKRAQLAQASRLNRTLLAGAEHASHTPGLRCLPAAVPDSE